MKTTIIAGLLVGFFAGSASAMDFCAQQSKPDVCYGAQFRVVNGARLYRNKQMAESNLPAATKKKWAANEIRFGQWVEANCNNYACAWYQVDKHNNWAYYELQRLGLKL